MSFLDKISEIKEKNQVYVIAELGSNWKTEEDLLSAVSIAKKIGCDAIKFQYLSIDELYGPKYQINKTFPLSRIKLKSDAVGIDLLCSSFSPEGVMQVDPFVVAHKVASSEMSHIRILEQVKKTGKPLILSTGAYSLIDIKRVIDFLGDYPLVVLHCNMSYPTKYTDTDKFLEIKKLSSFVGYSDHTLSIDSSPLLYKNLGAVVLEKHFNPFQYSDTPDSCALVKHGRV
jgi:N,N'-diacetyllegionaminate synthase